MLEKPGWNWGRAWALWGGCSSGEAAGDKTGAEVEQEMGHAHQSDPNSNKCLSVMLVPGSR